MISWDGFQSFFFSFRFPFAYLKVREACSMLDLPLEIRPCPSAIAGFADVLSAVTLGKRQVPYMVDSSAVYRPILDTKDDIIKHLFDSYGPGQGSIPSSLKSGGTHFID